MEYSIIFLAINQPSSKKIVPRNFVADYFFLNLFYIGNAWIEKW